MEKKRSAEVTVLGICMVLFSFFLIYQILKYSSRSALSVCLAAYWGIPSLIYLISAYGIFKLKKWAKPLAIYPSMLIVTFCSFLMFLVYTSKNTAIKCWAGFVWSMTIPFFVFCIPVIYFFARPKVKDK